MKKSIQKIVKPVQQGFTLVEVIVVTSLFTILSAVLLESIVRFYSINSYTISQSAEVDSARRGMELIVRDLREMTFADNGTYPLAVMGTSTIGFYSDIDRDNSVEYVRYVLTGTTLRKYVYNATGTPLSYSTTTPDETISVSANVRNIAQATSTFKFFDDNHILSSATSTVTDIRYIEVQLIVNVDPARSPGEFTIRSSAAPRNLKTEF